MGSPLSDKELQFAKKEDFSADDCWRAFKTDHLRALNFDQTFMDVDYYTTVDKSTKLTGS